MADEIKAEGSLLSYKQRIDAKIRDLLLEFECQPILFVGSGLSRRYIGAPNWLELLKVVAEKIPNLKGKFEYFRQKYDADPVKIGSEFVNYVFEWAWSEGRNEFPEIYFEEGVKKDIFLKFMCCNHLENILNDHNIVDDNLRKELEAFSAIRPHAVITTNYDLFLERIFDGYVIISG